jgi:cob(I)alamin adenosyltransferase
MNKSLVTVLTGSGKGKTTSGIGMAMGAASQNKKVFMAFFLKDDRFDQGEFKALRHVPGITYKIYGQGDFINNDQVNQTHRDWAYKALTDVRKMMIKSKFDMVILDEINVVVSMKMMDVDILMDFINSKPPKTELVLTGRDADSKIIEIADAVSEFLMIKHPYNTGQKARKGIDY